MIFNTGYMCPNCGPVKECAKKTISKAVYEVCKECGGVVKEWERPLNERAGRCVNCGAAKFKLAMHKRHIVRHCETCKEVFDIDDQKTLRPGNEALKYGHE